jgi:hypothetical protein
MATRQELVDIMKSIPLDDDDWVRLFMRKLNDAFPEMAAGLVRLAEERLNDSDQRQA